MNLAIKELADTKFEVVLCCCLSILNLFLLTSINIFLCVSYSQGPYKSSNVIKGHLLLFIKGSGVNENECLCMYIFEM